MDLACYLHVGSRWLLGSGLTTCLWHKRSVICMQRELVCVCFAPLVYSVMVIGFVFFPLIVVTAPAYACVVGQLMLSATMKIVRLSSYSRLCRTWMKAVNPHGNSSAKKPQKTIKQSPRSNSTSLPTYAMESVLMGRSRNSSRHIW